MDAELSQEEKNARIKDEVRIYHYPKIIFLYPTLIASIIAAVVLSFSDGVYEESTSATAMETQTDNAAPTDSKSIEPIKRKSAVLVTVIFLFLFTFNLFVMAFDFPQSKFLAVVFFIFAVVLGLVVVGVKSPELMGSFGDMISRINPVADKTFYWTMSGLLGFVFIIMYLARLLDYWVIRPNEVIHFHGLPRHTRRFSAPHMRFEMEINDIFEHMLLKSGRLYIRPTGDKEEFVLDNVINVRRKNERVNQILSALQVQLKDDAEI
ncbi:MAG: hypothetical protein HOB73_04000 [Planctomycetaceae bacterium]|jgi:hypothetical protein|nr:hypothetical protein [Planctomycetaceae bacterium]